MVLIPKGGNFYGGIGLMEVMWKVVAEILNRRLTASINFHDFIHGFREGCGTGTATLEAKLLQQLVLESTNTDPSNLKYNISMKCTVFTYHLA